MLAFGDAEVQMKMRWKRVVPCGLLAVAIPALQADTFGFNTCVTNNIASDCAIASAQMFVDVTDPGGGQVLFTFRNTGPLASSITDVYFDDGSLLGIANIINGAGVLFSQGASPPELPGANNASPPFVTTVGFLADSDPPAQPNGVNPGEQLGILFNLQLGKTFADTIAALTGPIDNNNDLRIGIHVQGFATGGSEGLINGSTPIPPQEVVPEPTSILLLGTVVLGMVHVIRKRRTA